MQKRRFNYIQRQPVPHVSSLSFRGSQNKVTRQQSGLLRSHRKPLNDRQPYAALFSSSNSAWLKHWKYKSTPPRLTLGQKLPVPVPKPKPMSRPMPLPDTVTSITLSQPKLMLIASARHHQLLPVTRASCSRHHTFVLALNLDQ